MTADARPASVWRRLWLWLRAVEEAMDLTYDDIQDRRIRVLESEVAALRVALDAERRRA